MRRTREYDVVMVFQQRRRLIWNIYGYRACSRGKKKQRNQWKSTHLLRVILSLAYRGRCSYNSVGLSEPETLKPSESLEQFNRLLFGLLGRNRRETREWPQLCHLICPDVCWYNSERQIPLKQPVLLKPQNQTCDKSHQSKQTVHQNCLFSAVMWRRFSTMSWTQRRFCGATCHQRLAENILRSVN